jgi:hypothetical protein
METPRLPRVNPIGLFESPPDFHAGPRRFSRRSRLLAAGLLLLFLGATLVTTTVSLGRYCLTSDAADTRALHPKTRL